MQPDERKPFGLKYMELPQVFNNRSTMIEITSKQSLRTCETLAKHLAKEKPRTPQEFERHEFLKDFVIKTSMLNEQVIELLEYLQEFCQDILNDAKVLQEGSDARNVIRDQSDTITILIDGREKDFLTIAELRKQQILSK